MGETAEGEEVVAEAAQTSEALMAGLIETAVEAHASEGIYGALDGVFETLAENANELANPETGVIEVEGNAIINTTYDALQSHFDESPELLMGAIGAGAARADERGDLQLLGGDQALICITTSRSSSSSRPSRPGPSPTAQSRGGALWQTRRPACWRSRATPS